MVAVTYGHAGVARTDRTKPDRSKPARAKPVAATAQKRNGWFARMLNAMQESQMRRARHEIALHRHLLPHDLERFGDELSPRSEHTLPFGRG
jgi:hypothetical protein